MGLISYGWNTYGVLLINGNPGSTVKLMGTGFTANYTIPDNGTLKTEVEPGSYTVIAEIRVPTYFVGDLSALVYTKTIKIGSGDLENITINDSLGTIKIRAPPGSNLRITWKTGVKNIEMPENGVLTLYASPGTYNVSVSYNSIPLTGTIVVGKGTSATIGFPVSEFNTSTAQKTSHTIIVSSIIVIIIAAVALGIYYMKYK